MLLQPGVYTLNVTATLANGLTSTDTGTLTIEGAGGYHQAVNATQSAAGQVQTNNIASVNHAARPATQAATGTAVSRLFADVSHGAIVATQSAVGLVNSTLTGSANGVADTAVHSATGRLNSTIVVSVSHQASRATQQAGQQIIDYIWMDNVTLAPALQVANVQLSHQ